MSYIEVKGASVVYNEGSDNQVDALADVHLRIEQKEFVIFFGPSGCGKTTLLNLVSGLERPTRGQVVIDGEDLSTFDADRMAKFHCGKIGMVFQAYNLIPSLSVLDNVILPRMFSGEFGAGQRRERAQALLEKFGVAAQAAKYPAQLSGGQQQRVAIARSLINDQPVILADEPVGNLDSKSAENVLHLLQELNEQEGKTIIMVTHNAEHLAFADHIFYMKDGRITNETFGRKRKQADFKDLKPEEKEFELLARSFTGLSEAQMNVLVAPFKAKVLVAYLTNALDFNQNQRLEEITTKRLAEEIGAEKFARALDLAYEEGGVGLNFKTAQNHASRIEAMLSNVRMLQADLAPLAAKLGLDENELRTKLLVRYFVKAQELDLAEGQLKLFEKIMLQRLENELDNEALIKLLDAPQAAGGMGLDIRLARKLAQEAELLLLLKFSQTQPSGNGGALAPHPAKRKLALIADDLRHIEDLLSKQL